MAYIGLVYRQTECSFVYLMTKISQRNIKLENLEIKMYYHLQLPDKHVVFEALGNLPVTISFPFLLPSSNFPSTTLAHFP